MSQSQESTHATIATRADARCVYAVVRTGDWRSDLVPDVPLRLVASGGVAAVIAAEPDAALGEPRRSLLVREHVVERLADSIAVAPVRPGAALTPEEVRRWLRAAGRSLLGVLEQLDGRCEIGVTAWCDAARLPADAAWLHADGVAEIDHAAERERLRGALARDPLLPAYFARRRLRAHQVVEAAATAERVAAAIHGRIGRIAAASARLAGADGVLLDAAYLVARTRLWELDEAVAELAARGGSALSLRRSAPRPAWRLASLWPGAPGVVPAMPGAT